MNRFSYVISISLLLSLSACKKSDAVDLIVDTPTETAEQIGEVVSGIDDGNGASTGTYSMESAKSFDRYAKQFDIPNPRHRYNIFETTAQAAACSAGTFSACSASTRTRSFSDCALGSTGATLSGSVVLSFSGPGAATCSIGANTSAVSRAPSFTISGIRGADFAVSTVGAGQSLTTTNIGTQTFSFANTGIRRKLNYNGTALLDLTTDTTSNITVTGTSRTGRVINGGTLRVTNNLNSTVCSVSPSTVTWTAGCKCPTSGSFSGTCTTGESMSVTFGGTCGSVTAVIGSKTKTVSLDSCNL